MEKTGCGLGPAASRGVGHGTGRPLPDAGSDACGARGSAAGLGEGPDAGGGHGMASPRAAGEPHAAGEPRGAHILIVDDETAIAGMLDEYFRMEGMRTSVAESGARALQIAGDADGSDPIDLVLLDVNMPGMDGFEVCRRLREHLACPIIFLTARVEDVDQIDGFAAGADDYVLKPFSLPVLGRRVSAHLAREERKRVAELGRVRYFEGLTIDYGEREVEVRSSDARAVVPLTRTEFDIVALLSKSPGRVFDRDLIYERVWGWDAEGDPSIVREHIRRIRKKFAVAGAEADCIETVWGVGYKWAAR